MRLAARWSCGASYRWQLERRDEALALSSEVLAFVRKLSVDNPDVRTYRDELANALGAHGVYLQVLGQTDKSVSFVRQAAQILETMADPDASTLATASFSRVRIAGLLAGDSHEFKSWPPVVSPMIESRAMKNRQPNEGTGQKNQMKKRRNKFDSVVSQA